MRVIGAGLPRTGTISLAAALEILGFGPVLHAQGDNASQFTKLLHAKTAFPTSPVHDLQSLAGVSLSDIVSPYNTTLDSPCIDFYSELLQLHADSVVILSERSSDTKWWESWHGTLGMYFDDMPTLRARIPGFILWLLFWPVPEIAEVAAMVKAYVDLWKRLYGLYGKEIHTLHRGRVERTVPREKLLVFNVEEGWGPLCRFLGVEVPDLPFPRLNDSRQLNESIARTYRQAGWRWFRILGGVLGCI